MPDRALLLSIRPEYAKKIFDGSKTVELRRVRPRVARGDLVLVYASAPVKAVLGAFEVARVRSGTPTSLWNIVVSKAGVTRRQFDAYFLGAKTGYAIFLKRKWLLEEPLGLDKLRKRQSNFRPPQSYHYLSASQADRIGIRKLFQSDTPGQPPRREKAAWN
jgi:predicted transcriptional regulator